MLEERLYPVRHKRFRIQGTGRSAGSHIDVAVTPDGKGFCLHVFDDRAKVATTLTVKVENAGAIPVGLCATCDRVTKAKQN